MHFNYSSAEINVKLRIQLPRVGTKLVPLLPGCRHILGAVLCQGPAGPRRRSEGPNPTQRLSGTGALGAAMGPLGHTGRSILGSGVWGRHRCWGTGWVCLQAGAGEGLGRCQESQPARVKAQGTRGVPGPRGWGFLRGQVWASEPGPQAELLWGAWAREPGRASSCPIVRPGP